MLICPQCKFENPNTNKFCQNCGATLTHKVCSQCDAYVPLNAYRCHSCGAECGKIWWAIITKLEKFAAGEVEKQLRDVELQGVEGENTSQTSPVTPSFLSSLTVGSYLDSQQRYQLLEPLPDLEELTTNTQLCVRVLDCQPYQISPLEALTLNQSQGLATLPIEIGNFSNLTKAYVALQSHINQGIPPIHDAWQQANIQLILIEDRSGWPYLLEFWRDETTNSLQIINCFYQMTQLWVLLEPLNCCQSLLDLRNLRLDEDQTLALQMLYVEPLKNLPLAQLSANSEQQTATSKEYLTIQALGFVWQKLFQESQRTQFGSLLQLLGDLEIGKIQTLLQLQSRLQAIAAELQAISTTSKSNVTSSVDQDIDLPITLQLHEPEEDSATKSDDLPTVVLPMQLSSLEHSGLTDVGRQRNHNEDYFGIEAKINKLELPNSRTVEARALYIICDGMGGHAGGEVASALAVNTIRQYFQTHWVTNELPTEDQIREAVRQANQAIFDVNQQDARSGIGRMGTTLVMLLIQNTQAAVAHVGDSRLYCVTRKGGLEQVTIDHEVGQREISRGVEPDVAYGRPDAYQLTQALGPRDENFIIPDVNFFEISEDTLFVLASDGLSDNGLVETTWQAHLLPLLNFGANLEDAVRNLIDLANDYNGHDNITVVLVRAKVRPNLESPKEMVSL